MDEFLIMVINAHTCIYKLFLPKAYVCALMRWLCLCVCFSRPFQRTITMHKDSSGHVGFIYKAGKITSLVKDGSAARNGLLTEHYICEINGQNVIGLKVRHLILSFHQMVWSSIYAEVMLLMGEKNKKLE